MSSRKQEDTLSLCIGKSNAKKAGSELATLTIYFFHRLDEILRILETDKSEAFGLIRPLVSNDLCSLERRVLAENPCQHFIRNVVAQITAKQPKIV